MPPIGKQKQYPDLPLTVIHAIERGAPRDRKKIEWKLITNLPVESLAEAIEKLEWYAMRWKIETFHKILKSVCQVEGSKLRTAERLVNLIAICCVLSVSGTHSTIVILLTEQVERRAQRRLHSGTLCNL